MSIFSVRRGYTALTRLAGKFPPIVPALAVLTLTAFAIPRPASAAPTAPGPTMVSCAYSTGDDCWVTGDFLASVSPASGGTGSLVYQICRSIDSAGGFSGCDVNLTLNGGTSITVSGAHLPSDGYRRAFYFLARDSSGVLGPWNTPRYVRVDRSAPAVSATNASDTWFSSRTATLSASDTVGGASANSGLLAVRYNWNMPLDANCTSGTSTSSGATLTAPAGDNLLYLCGRDNTGRVGQWSGRYRVSAPLTAPGPTTVSCAYSVSDDCWVTGDFTASVTPAAGGSGGLVYQICRSVDSVGGFSGCDVNLNLNGGTSIAVSGTLPSDGYRRAFYFLARDSSGVLGPWNTPRYVRVDRYAPVVSATNASDTWFGSRTATLAANDTAGGAGANSGLVAFRSGWNTPLDAGCTTGTAASPGATLTAPAGDNLLYLCGRDNTGRVGQWSGRYRVSTPPTAPGPTAVSCAYSVSDDCWVTGDFVISATPATGGTGSLAYEICRSNDSAGGFSGCDVNLSLNGGTSFAISGVHLPADGYRRAYYFLARDSVGVLGPWNTARYVRVDRYAPEVSATNASDLWFSNRTATLSASDTVGGAGANSGLLMFRYSWNLPLDAGCTTGTAASAGATLTAPAGDNLLYLCARDNTGRVGQWSGRYRVGAVAITAPGPTTVSCAYSVSDDCWVTGDFVISATPATGGTGSLVYEICRSIDSTGGFSGCDVNLTLNGGTSFAVSGSHLPADGYRRAYYFLARDSAGVLGPWNTARYVRVDRNAPLVSATNASDIWYSNRTAALSASDTAGGAGANSGLVAFRYSWNTALDAGCTTGTPTSSGKTLVVPAGDNLLYLCGRDNTGRVGQWSGQYRVGNLPTAPGPTTVGCAYSTGDDCWVTGGFTASVTPATGGAGGLVYQICRSVDSAGGFAGCDVNLTLNGGTSIAVAGADLPSDGFRRAYYFLARDTLEVLGPWNTPRYVRVDRSAPLVSATNASDDWFPSRTATVAASDTANGAAANSGLLAVRYSWNSALDAGCTAGTATSPGAVLAAPAGDNLLYLCAVDNTGRIGQWSGRYRVGPAPLSLTTTPSPSEAPYGSPIFWRATATGGDPATRQYALFRRRPGSPWHPALNAPVWQAGVNLGWTPTSSNLGVWEIAVWVRDGNTPANANTYGYAASFDPGLVEIVAPQAVDFTLGLTPAAVNVVRGGQAHLTVTLTGEPGFTGTASLSVSGLPAAASSILEPAAIGSGDTAALTVVTTADTPLSTSVITVTATAGSQTRTATAEVRVVAPQKPVLTRITPDSIGNGGHVRVTVQGSYLSGSTVSIAQEQTDPDEPVSRVFPTASVVSINAAGTSMEVDIDASDPHILDFYNLVVDNGADIEAIPFRVLPGGPLVDAWTPSQPQVDRIHALSIAGRNLAGTMVSASVGGRILLHSVETSDTEITAILEVLPNAPTGPMKLIVSDSHGRRIEVPITIVPPQGSSLASRNLTENKDGQKVDDGAYRRPAIWFQEFTIRDPDKTEVVPEGLRIQSIDREAYLAAHTRKSISFDLYIRVTIPLVRVQWQKVIVYDPVTGALGDAVLQALGVGARVPIGAFVISAYFQMDLTIYFRLTNTGFTFPRFCIEITYGIEVTGFDGFAYNQSFCVGGGWYASGTGSVSNGSITGGECASVTPTRFEDGFVEGMVEQNACCSQPIGVAMSGNTFTGLSWGRSFSINNPQAAATTSNQATCPCPCSVSFDGTALTPGSSTSGNINLKNTSNAPCTYQYELRQASGQTQMNLSGNQGALTVNGNSTAAQPVTVSFPAGRPAPDVATLEVVIQHTDASGQHLACQSSKISCVYPTGETSTFEGWWAVEPSDVARFLGHLTPSNTDFTGRTVTEGSPNSGGGSFDNCFFSGSPFPNYAQNNLSGGIWNIVAGNTYHEADLIGMKCVSPQLCDLNGYYASVNRAPCSMGTTQQMQMSCGPMQAGTPVIPYATNTFRIDVTTAGTRITRDNATSPLH